MRKSQFKLLVSKKIKTLAFNYLISKVKSKGKEIQYGDDFRCQNYLLPNKVLTLEDQLNIFAYRTRMNNLEYNFASNNCLQVCVCKNQMTNEHLYSCRILNTEENNYILYNTLFQGTLTEKKKIIIILNKNMNKFEQITKAQM